MNRFVIHGWETTDCSEIEAPCLENPFQGYEYLLVPFVER